MSCISCGHIRATAQQQRAEMGTECAKKWRGSYVRTRVIKSSEAKQHDDKYVYMVSPIVFLSEQSNNNHLWPNKNQHKKFTYKTVNTRKCNEHKKDECSSHVYQPSRRLVVPIGKRAKNFGREKAKKLLDEDFLTAVLSLAIVPRLVRFAFLSRTISRKILIYSFSIIKKRSSNKNRV